jgi:hypothetical protein
MFDRLLIHGEILVCCLGEPSSITIPRCVREISDSALAGCNSLKILNFEEGTVRHKRV